MRRKHQSAKIELQLLGLLDEPDAGASRRMEAFDRLPAKLRRELDEGPFDFNAIKVLEGVEFEGASSTEWKIKRSVQINLRDFVRERRAALEWARDAFRNGPRPKHEPSPGGWTVHNFPG